MKTSEWLERSPFKDEFLKQEIEWYGKPKGLQYMTINGICNDYLNVNFRTNPGFQIPKLEIDDTVWMSLTWMEAQSNWPAIAKSHGRVGTLGLGMGYFALRAAEKPEVEMVTVFESNKSVIDWFRREFKGRLDKIEIVHGDARETCRGQEFNYLYSDIYPKLCMKEMVDDVELFTDENHVWDYSFWTQERYELDACDVYGMMSAEDLSFETISLLKHWLDSDLSNLRRDVLDKHSVFDFVSTR